MPTPMKQNIADAFLKLSRRKPVDKITVKDLVEECGITRQTFYYHFQDIFEVIEWIFRRQMEELLQKTLKQETPHDALKVLIEAFYCEPGIVEKLINSQKREQTEQILFQVGHSYLEKVIEEKTEFRSISKADMDVALDFYSFAICGFLFNLRKQKNLDVDILADQLVRLISGSFLPSEPGPFQ